MNKHLDISEFIITSSYSCDYYNQYTDSQLLEARFMYGKNLHEMLRRNKRLDDVENLNRLFFTKLGSTGFTKEESDRHEKLIRKYESCYIRDSYIPKIDYTTYCEYLKFNEEQELQIKYTASHDYLNEKALKDKYKYYQV